MKTAKYYPWKDYTWNTGIALILLSTVLFLFPHLVTMKDEFFGLIVGNYGIAIAYFFILLTKGGLKLKTKDFSSYQYYVPLYLVLCLISAFSLNREINVFNDSAPWLRISLILMCITFIGISFRTLLPQIFSQILFFLLGASLMICLYFSIYLSPFYPIAILASFVLGLSIHLLVPLGFVSYIIWFIRKFNKEHRNLSLTFSMGAVIPLLIAIYFTIAWNSINKEINFTYNAATTDYRSELPPWVSLSQKLDNDWITERILKSDLLYLTHHESSSFFSMPQSRSFAEVKQHDPLVVIATALTKTFEIPETEKIKILECMYDAEHLAQERLWGGKDLSTINVITDVMLYPEQRLSYTEKIIDIKNDKQTNGWRGEQQEAIYTFYLPEGTVVTSLSLWINGKEEKGILTTKAKADSAYKTIVGVEARDPSLVHWQEGNTISVRIFPCTPSENRKFKIGFSSPLRIKGTHMCYDNIYFKGPSPEQALESILIRTTDPSIHFYNADEFEKINEKTYQRNHAYQDRWNLEMDLYKIKESSFSFDGNTYSINNYKKNYTSFLPDKIYLDLNASWTKKEFEDALNLLKDHSIFVAQESTIKISPENKEEIFKQFSKLNFSLFPFHKINTNTLVITKCEEKSPNLKNLKDSEFISNLFKELQVRKDIKLFNIGDILSPYLKTLKELRSFEYDKGNLEDLTRIINKKEFAGSSEAYNTITIHNAGIQLKKHSGTTSNTAPDHLMRLYAYNDIMKSINKEYFAKNFINDSLITKAQQANVVSPLSSLIVLETVEDYQRFDIKNDTKSLENASMKSAGAVPEPHEWLLIILSLIVIGYLLVKNNQKKTYVS